MTPSAPLLTAELARDAAMHCDHPSTMTLNALQALADGRTVCVRVMSEAQAREAFNEWWRSGGGMACFGKSDAALKAWMACARAMGAVSGEKK